MIEIENLGSLGRYLKTARQMAGLSVQTLAEKLGYDPGVLKTKEEWCYPGLTILEAEQVLRACGLSVRITIGKGV
jgi:transcriptional regulator with XRE-family HTH domain